VRIATRQQFFESLRPEVTRVLQTCIRMVHQDTKHWRHGKNAHKAERSSGVECGVRAPCLSCVLGESPVSSRAGWQGVHFRWTRVGRVYTTLEVNPDKSREETARDDSATHAVAVSSLSWTYFNNQTTYLRTSKVISIYSPALPFFFCGTRMRVRDGEGASDGSYFDICFFFLRET